jgi:hypothetical protein
MAVEQKTELRLTEYGCESITGHATSQHVRTRMVYGEVDRIHSMEFECQCGEFYRIIYLRPHRSEGGKRRRPDPSLYEDPVTENG